MDYLCADCGAIFNEDDMGSNTYRQYADGVCIDEVILAACPECGSEDLCEVARCAICDDWHADDELIGGLCEACLKDVTTPENAWKFSKAAGEMKRIMISVPDVVADNFERREITEMVRRSFCELKDDPRIADYCMFDKESFAEFCANIAKKEQMCYNKNNGQTQ